MGPNLGRRKARTYLRTGVPGLTCKWGPPLKKKEEFLDGWFGSFGKNLIVYLRIYLNYIFF